MEDTRIGGVRIPLKHIEHVTLKFKEANVIVSLETYMSPADVARLYNLSKQGVPMQAVIESPQAEFDLQINEVNTFTGELKNPAIENIPANAEGSQD